MTSFRKTWGSSIAPATYHEIKAQQADPARRPERVCRDDELRAEIQCIHRRNFPVYGARKV